MGNGFSCQTTEHNKIIIIFKSVNIYMSNILVTGATGFIGQHLVRSLLDDQHTVRALRHNCNQLHFFGENEVEWWEGDLRIDEELKGIADGISLVYHLAAFSREDITKSWDDYVSVNVKGTENLLREAESSGVKRFVNISTVEAVGFGDGVNPRRESDTPAPCNYYGKSKLEAEKLVMNKKWSEKCVTIRLPMIYGPGTFLIVPKLFGMVKRGFYPLIGSGSSKMEFCYVENAVNAIKLAGEKREAIGELFYASDERSYTIKEVITHIAKAMNKRVRFIHIPVFVAMFIGAIWEIFAKILPFPPFVSPHSKKPFFSRETVWWTTRNVNIVSIDKIKDMLGYKPLISIDEGCRRTAKWLSSKLDW